MKVIDLVEDALEHEWYAATGKELKVTCCAPAGAVEKGSGSNWERIERA